MMVDPRTNAEALAGLFDTDMLLTDEFSRKKKKAAPVDPAAGLLGIAAPKTPWEQMQEKHGTGGSILRMLGTGLSGGLLGDVLMPEMGVGSRAKYATDMELYKAQQAKMFEAQLAAQLAEQSKARHMAGIELLMNGVDDPEDAFHRMSLSKEFGLDNLQYALGGGVKPNDETMTFKDFNTNYRKDTQAFADFQDQYTTLQDSLSSDSGVGDLGLVFGLAKLFDPRSVVREGEVTTLQSTAGLPAQVMNMYKEVKEGRKLAPIQREQIRDYADRAYINRLGKYDQVRERFIERGEKGFGFSNLATRLDDRANFRGEVDAIAERLARSGMPKKDAKEVAEDMVDQAMAEFMAGQNPDQATYIFPSAGNR